MLRTSLLASLITLASATPAIAQSGLDHIALGDPEKVAAALQHAGYKAQIKLDKDGDTYISSAANGDPFSVNFYGCTGSKNCTSISLSSWWEKESYFSDEMANEWNSKKRFLRVYIDADGDLIQSMDVTAAGTVSSSFFEDTIDWYGVMASELRKFLDDKEASTKKPVK